VQRSKTDLNTWIKSRKASSVSSSKFFSLIKLRCHFRLRVVLIKLRLNCKICMGKKIRMSEDLGIRIGSSPHHHLERLMPPWEKKSELGLHLDHARGSHVKFPPLQIFGIPF
jgi:hypothetical protein